MEEGRKPDRFRLLCDCGPTSLCVCSVGSQYGATVSALTVSDTQSNNKSNSYIYFTLSEGIFNEMPPLNIN